MSKKKKKKNNTKKTTPILQKEPERIKKEESFKKYYFIIAGIMTLTFLFMYGIKILNPKYINWIFAGNYDIMQHYVGWQSFRLGKWMFPIGLTNATSYPLNISVIYTDSIPIIAVFFKLISFMLPKNFQYLGLYGLLCFILQGIISAKIIKKYTKSKLTIILVSILMIITPSMLFRLFYHTALASHWLLLLSLESLFLYDEFEEKNKIYYFWALIAFLVCSIHMYYLLMCGIILVGYITLDILKTKKIKKSIILLITYITTSLITIWLFGGFVNISGGDSFGLGKFSYNLNGLINSQNWSVFVKSLPMIQEQYEGFSYLGLGVILLAIIALVLKLLGTDKTKDTPQDRKNFTISLIVISILCTIVAASPKVYLGEKLLFELKLPKILNEIWGIFRSTGRIIWPVIYIITLSSIITILKRLNWKAALTIILICTFIQIVDSGARLSENHSFYTTTQQRNEHMDFSNYEYLNIAAKNPKIELLAFASEDLYDTDKIGFSNWALNNNIKTTKMFFARKSFNPMLDKSTKKILTKKDDKTIFLFSSKDECTNNELNCYKLPNDYYLGYINSLE